MSQRTHSPMQIAMAQLNPLLGDCAGNAQAIFQAAHVAHQQGASLLLTPELSLTGYPPEDLLLRPGFIQETRTVLQSLCDQLQELRGLTVIVGPLRIRCRPAECSISNYEWQSDCHLLQTRITQSRSV